MNAATDTGTTALYAVSLEGHVDVMQALLDCGAKVSGVGCDGRYNPLFAATKNGHLPAVDCLIARGVDVNAQNSDGMTALHVAASMSNAAPIEQLLRHGAAPDISDFFNRTPLHLAIYYCNLAAVEILLSAAANPNIVDGYGRTCMDAATLYEPILQKLAKYNSECLRNPFELQWRQLKKSVVDLGKMLLEKEQMQKSAVYHLVGHSLLLLGALDDACTAFECQIHMTSKDGRPVHDVLCNGHPSELFIVGHRFVCRTCADVDLCHICMASYEHHQIVKNCRDHSFLEIPRDNRKIEAGDETSELAISTRGWLQRLLGQYDSET